MDASVGAMSRELGLSSKPATDKPGLVRLINAGLQEYESGEISAHGWVDIESIRNILVGSYQREVLGFSTGGRGEGPKSKLMRAIQKNERLPDIILAMRGSNFRSKGDDIILEDPVFVVDGLQRISNMMRFAEKFPERASDLRIGAEVRFGTTVETENELFIKLNAGGFKVPLSPNIILRNERTKYNSLLTLYGLSTNSPSFPLNKRVQWGQRRNRGELLTALMLCRVASGLHARFLPSGSKWGGGARSVGMGPYLDRMAHETSLRNFRSNVEEFFEFIDRAFGLRKIEYRELAIQTKGNFLLAMTRILSDHDNFWDGKKLAVSMPWVRKFSGFATDAPEVVRLAASGSSALPILYGLVRDHLNKGKRVNKLIPHRYMAVSPTDDDDEETNEGE